MRDCENAIVPQFSHLRNGNVSNPLGEVKVNEKCNGWVSLKQENMIIIFRVCKKSRHKMLLLTKEISTAMKQRLFAQ